MPVRKWVPVSNLRLDAGKLYEALDHERLQRDMTLEEVAAELDVAYSTLACWRRGGGMNGDVVVRLAIWLPITDLRTYARYAPADPPPETQGAAA